MLRLTDHEPANEINVTPFLDVLLVLLIMSILLLGRHYMVVQLPEKQSGPEPPTPRIVLEVLPGGHFALNRQSVARDSLEQYLRQTFDRRPSKVLYVRGDPRVRYQEVITAMDIARGAGVSVLAIDGSP